MTLPFFVQWLMHQGKRLREKSIQEQFGAIYEDFNIRFMKSRNYIWFDLFRRMIVCTTVIVLDGYPTQ